MSVKNEQYLEESAKTLFCRNAFFIFMEKKKPTNQNSTHFPRKVEDNLCFSWKKGFVIEQILY